MDSDKETRPARKKLQYGEEVWITGFACAVCLPKFHNLAQIL